MGRTKRRIDGGLSLLKTLRVHLTAHVPTSGDVGVVHHVGVHICVRNQSDVVSGHIRVTSPQVVVKCSDTVGNTTDNPVITDVHIIKGSGLDCRKLRSSNGSTQIDTTVDRVMSASAACGHLVQNSFVGGNQVSQVLLERPGRYLLESVAVMDEQHIGVGHGLQHREVSHLLCIFNGQVCHFLIPPCISSLPE